VRLASPELALATGLSYGTAEEWGLRAPLIRFTLHRLASLIATLAVASVVVFTVMEVVPGDAAAFMLGMNASPETVSALRAELGLDAGPIERYMEWIGGLVTGDFGTSYTYRTPVGDMIAERLRVSLPLALLALLFAMAISFPVGIWAAARRGTVSDTLAMGGAQLGIAVPNFWFAMILVLVFSVNLRWFSAGGFPGWESGLAPALQSLVLPSIALALPQASILARVIRSALIETLGEDFIRTARAKGLTRSQVLRRHALRNAAIPVLTILGLQFSFLLAGAIIIENVFFLPGLGRLAFQAIAQRDIIVVESVVMLLVLAVVLVNFLIDLAYAAVDPRLRGN
jgi:peptide/nickel transport system permease protein